MVMTPSAISFAIALPFGPMADSNSGTSIGRLRGELLGVDHLGLGAVDVHRLAAEQAAQLLEVPTCRRPRQRGLPEHPPRRCAGPEAAREPPGREVVDRRDGRGRRHDVAQVRDEHRGAEVDVRVLRDAAQATPRCPGRARRSRTARRGRNRGRGRASRARRCPGRAGARP